MLLTRLSVLFFPPCVGRRLPLYPKALNVMKIKQLSVNMPSCQQTLIVKYTMISQGCMFRELSNVSSAATELSQRRLVTPPT
jgi:hypothetical protein